VRLLIPRKFVIVVLVLAALSAAGSITAMDPSRQLETISRASISTGLIKLANAVHRENVVAVPAAVTENPKSQPSLGSVVMAPRDSDEVSKRYRAIAVSLAILTISLIGVVYLVRFSSARRSAILRLESLGLREARARSLLNQVSDAILQVDAEGIIQDCNAQTTHMFGHQEQDLIGQNISMVLSEPDQAQEMIKAHAGFASFDVNSSERLFRVMAKRQDGLTFPVEVSVGRTEIKGEILFTGTVRDASEKARLEADLSRTDTDAKVESHLTAELVRLVSKESRGALQNIIDVTKTLRNTDLGTSQLHHTSSILRSTQELNNTWDDIIQLIGFGAKEREKSGTGYCLDNLIEQIVSSVGAAAAEANISVSTFVDPDVPADLYGDPSELRKILRYLIGSALKHAVPGELAFEASVEQREADQAKLSFCASGSAVNVSMDDIEVHNTATKNGSGTSHSRLKLLKSAITAVDGCLKLEMDRGDGSAITASAWLQVAEAENVNNYRTLTELEGLRSLVVGNEGTGRDILTKQLEATGISVTCVSDPYLADDSLRSGRNCGKPYDLAIFDISVTEIGNTSSVLDLVANEFDSITRYVVLAHSPANEGETNTPDRYVTYVAKPAHQSVLIPAIANLLNRTADAGTSHLTTIDQSEVNILRPLSGRRVLVAVSDEQERKQIARSSQELGATVDQIGNGNTAVEAAIKTPYDLILVDKDMSGLDGTEASLNIKKHYEYEPRPKIVMLAADATAIGETECFLMGVDKIVVKPLHHNQLIEIADHCLENISPSCRAKSNATGETFRPLDKASELAAGENEKVKINV